MSSYIGTNFAYDAKDFLDDRISKARSKADLKSWNIDVPEGFEICLCESPDTGGVWYYYDSTINLEDTGHWVPRVSSSSENYVSENQAASITLVQSVVDSSLSDFKSKPVIKGIKVEEPNTYEVRPTDPKNPIYPKLYWTIEYSKLTWSANTSGTVKWEIEKDDETNIAPQAITVKGGGNVSTWANNPIEFSLGTSPNYWTSVTKPLPTNNAGTYTYEVTYTVSGTGTVLSGSASYYFRLRRYFGAGKGNTLRGITNNSTISYNLFNDSNSTSRTDDLTEGRNKTVTFNCNGGYHPYFLIPMANFSSDPENTKMNVGGFDVTDFTVVRNVTVTNRYGIDAPYYLLYLNNEQNGTIKIVY